MISGSSAKIDLMSNSNSILKTANSIREAAYLAHRAPLSRRAFYEIDELFDRLVDDLRQTHSLLEIAAPSDPATGSQPA